MISPSFVHREQSSYHYLFRELARSAVPTLPRNCRLPNSVVIYAISLVAEGQRLLILLYL